ncbi:MULTISPECIES: ABC transporter permease [unclassified Pseudarthrobacter]|uniref:ABC transporter permease n=1 Tax=unclassified Pseudarthrobacter TaxID=2647000 RepID=UPI003636082F
MSTFLDNRPAGQVASGPNGNAAPVKAPRLPWRPALRSVFLWLSILVLAVIVLWAVFPALFTSHNPLLGTGADKLLPPSGEHPFGTDQTGRDLYSRVVHGTSLSLTGAAIAVLLALVAGTLLGLVAGYAGGWLDDAVMRLTDVMLAVPSILLSMAIITVLGRGTLVVAVAVGIAGIGSVTRTMRSAVLKALVAPYVEAARAGGARWWSIMFSHVLPAARGPVVVLATIEFGTALLSIAGLSFLGYGEPPPAPEWGALMSTGRDYMATSWWLVSIPGLVVVAVVLSINRISQSLQAWGDKPKGKS